MTAVDFAPDYNRIRDLNDDLRTTFIGGAVVCTPGFLSLPESQRAKLLQAVRSYDAFTADNDPHGEHDFGQITVGDCVIMFKIDYYDRSVRVHSPDPADPALTTRVLTIMLSSEY